MTDTSADSTDAETASQPQAGEEREANVMTTDEGTAGKRAGQRTFGSLSPQEAGRRSAQARRERSIAQAEQIRQASDGRVVLVRVPVQLGNIVARLAADAEKGQTQAVQQLRALMQEYPAEDETDLSVLDRRTRQQVIARVLADIEKDEGQPPRSVTA